MGAGYSGTPLVEKLGIHEGGRRGPPGGAEGVCRTVEGPGAERPPGFGAAGSGRFDVLIPFAQRSSQLSWLINRGKARREEPGGVWIGRPRKSSGAATDVSEDVARRAALDAGLLDNTVRAIDETWSGLRLAIHLQDRAGR